jgi:hypothetical protein
MLKHLLGTRIRQHTIRLDLWGNEVIFGGKAQLTYAMWTSKIVKT